MTKKQKEREEELAGLRDLLKPGDEVFTSVLHVGRTGMSRDIKVWIVRDNWPLNISYAVAVVTGNRCVDSLGGVVSVRVGGCGMDMGFALVYSLSSALFPNGFKCLGKLNNRGLRCPSNDHTNARPETCPVCGKKNPKEGAYKRGWHVVCSRRCVRAPWVHSSGGYALRQWWA